MAVDVPNERDVVDSLRTLSAVYPHWTGVYSRAATEIETLRRQREVLRALVRPICAQCGQAWSARACGVTHAIAYSALKEEG